MPEHFEAVDAFIGYVPVISDAYEKLFTELPKGSNCYVLGSPVLEQFPDLHKDIRALAPERAAVYLGTSGFFGKVSVANSLDLSEVTEPRIHVPEDEIVSFIEALMLDKEIVRHAVFLRWHRDNATVNVDIEPDRRITPDDFHKEVVGIVREEAEEATNWWRGVGAVLIVNGQVAGRAHNANMPSDYTQAIDGDPRSSLKRGIGIEITNDVHAEATLIAHAARQGIVTEGAEMLVDTFPCPKCAKDLVNAGIARCYYLEGYSVTDAYSVLKAAGIEIVKIETDQTVQKSKKVRLVDYPAR